MFVFLQGHIAVEAALRAAKRDMDTLYVKHGAPSRDLLRAMALADTQGVNIIRAAREELDALSGTASHGGILLKCGPRRWDPPDALIMEGTPLFMCVEGIEDPFNLGAAIRAAYASGAAAMLLTLRDWASADAVIARASAGAYDTMTITPLCEDTAADIKAAGARIILADAAPDAAIIYDADLTGRALLAIGGERRGVSKFIRDRADLKIRIPYGAPFPHALPTATAAAIAAFEAMRQRRG